jgi:hypothetical protein
VFPTWQTWLDWRKTQTDPPTPSTESHVLGPPALIRPSGKPQFTIMSVPHLSFGFAGVGIGGEAGGAAKAFVVEAFTAPTVDHLCLQFAHHADFEPVYRIQGGTYTVFGYSAADKPQSVVAYDASGHEVSRGDGTHGLLPPDGM